MCVMRMPGTEKGQDLANVTQTTDDATETPALVCDAEAGFLSCTSVPRRGALSPRFSWGHSMGVPHVSGHLLGCVYCLLPWKPQGGLWATEEEAGW